jgi:hypothetical protein
MIADRQFRVIWRDENPQFQDALASEYKTKADALAAAEQFALSPTQSVAVHHPDGSLLKVIRPSPND